jgi:hypothetical protein
LISAGTHPGSVNVMPIDDVCFGGLPCATPDDGSASVGHNVFARRSDSTAFLPVTGWPMLRRRACNSAYGMLSSSCNSCSLLAGRGISSSGSGAPSAALATPAASESRGARDEALHLAGHDVLF